MTVWNASQNSLIGQLVYTIYSQCYEESSHLHHLLFIYSLLSSPGIALSKCRCWCPVAAVCWIIKYTGPWKVQRCREGDGLQDLTVNEVDVTLSKAMAHSNELVQRARQLQAHFQQAQRGMLEINRLCDQADSSIVQGQTLLNRSAHRIHELKQALERHQQALGTAPDISRWPCWDARCMTCGEVARMARFGSLKVGKCQEWLRKTWGLTAEHLQ